MTRISSWELKTLISVSFSFYLRLEVKLAGNLLLVKLSLVKNFYSHKCLLALGSILVHLVLPATLWDRDYTYPHFTDKETGSVLPEAT